MPFSLPKISIYTRKTSFIGVMTALCISSNYLMIGLTNIKFMDLFVFISGYIMGSFPGASVGILTWLIYGTFNPYGFSLPILVATCIGESVYGVVGGFSAKFGLNIPPATSNTGTKKAFWASNLKIGILGFILTFIYDLFTNIISGMTVGIPPVVAIIMGVPFAINHEVSNFLFFFFAGNALIGAIQRLTFRGGEM